jgi:hypothetical protein
MTNNNEEAPVPGVPQQDLWKKMLNFMTFMGEYADLKPDPIESAPDEEEEPQRDMPTPPKVAPPRRQR